MSKHRLFVLLVLFLATVTAYSSAMAQDDGVKVFLPSVIQPPATSPGSALPPPEATPSSTPSPTSPAATATATPTPTDDLLNTSTPTFTPTDIWSPTSTPSFTPTHDWWLPTSTSTPTNEWWSPTPTSTPTTPPPSTTPIATPPTGLTVLNNRSWYVGSIDYLHLVGEVYNGTGSRAELIKVTANLFNSSSQLLDTDFSFVRLDSLSPGDKSCFHILFLRPPDPSTIASVEFEIDAFDSNEESFNLALLNVSSRYDATFGWYEIIGQIRNDDSASVDYPNVVVTLYSGPGESGSVLRCDRTYTSADSLAPGQSSAFKLTSFGLNPGEVGSYRLQAQASRFD